MTPAFKSIVHPTDLDQAGRDAFAHGLKLAVAAKGRFAIVHSQTNELEDEARLEGFPHVRDTLASWGLLDLSTAPEDVETALGIRVSKVDLGGQSPVDALVDYIGRHEADLVVLATHARDGLPRWLIGSVAENIFAKSGITTLFLPHQSRGFVELETGALTLRNILIPIDHTPPPRAALDAIATLVDLLDAQAATLHLLHVGGADSMPAELGLPSWLSARAEIRYRQGAAVETIIQAADGLDADLIVMATEGRHGPLDVFRGSVTEAVLRQAHRPLLAVPA